MEQKIIDALVKCPLFDGMSATEIEITLSGAAYRIVDYDKHDIYALAGMPYQYADIVISGELILPYVVVVGKASGGEPSAAWKSRGAGFSLR